MAMLEEVRKLLTAVREDAALSAEDREDTLWEIQRQLLVFPAYFNAVITEEIRLSVAMFHYDGDAVNDMGTAVDQGRRDIHMSAVAAANVINRIGKSYGVFPIIGDGRVLDPESKEDRDYTARQVYKFCNLVYLHGRKVPDDIAQDIMEQDLYAMGQDGTRFAEEGGVQ